MSAFATRDVVVAGIRDGRFSRSTGDEIISLITQRDDLLAALERANSDLLEIGGNCDCDGECANCTRVEEASGRVVAAIAKAVGK